MKKTLFIIGFVCSSILGTAQKDSSFFEIGLNVFPVIRNYNSAESDITLNPYALQLEKSFGKFGLRVGAGYRSIENTEEPSDFNGQNTFVQDTSTMDLRLGVVLYKNFNEKWSIKYGVDAIVANRSSNSNTIFVNANNIRHETTNNTESSGFGVAPFIFAQYHFSKNFSIGTEMSFRYLNNEISTVRENTEFPEFNAEINRTKTEVELLFPTALFVIVRF
ncbi:MAG: hypothetical protein ACK50N_06140 [Flavobacteriales bacterium]|jgi:hypothetical protein